MEALRATAQLVTSQAPVLLMSLLKVTLLLATALLLDRWLLTRVSALARHRFWTAALAMVLILPFAGSLLPAWSVLPSTTAGAPQVEAARNEARIPRTAIPAIVVGRPSARVDRLRSADDHREPVSWAETRSTIVAAQGGGPVPSRTTGLQLPSTLATSAFAVWFLGTLVALAFLVSALRRERRLLRAARPLGARWNRDRDQVANILGLTRRVRLGVHAASATPLTGGILRPMVILPLDAGRWSAERRRLVLAHELVHVLRHDSLRQLLARTLLAIYWFHPLLRAAIHRAAVAREQACDEAVLALGTRPSDYAGHLLALADPAPVHSPAAILAMAHPSQLERRLLVILDPNRPLRGGILAAFALLVILAGGVALAAAAPAPPVPPVLPVPPAPAVPALPGVPAPPAAPLPTTPMLAPTPPRPMTAPPRPRTPVVPPAPPAAPVIAAMGWAPSAPAALASTAFGASRTHEDTVCVEGRRGDFHGSTWVQNGTRMQMIGTLDGERVFMQQVDDDLRICARSSDFDFDFDFDRGGRLNLEPASWLDVETIGRRGRQRLRVTLDADRQPHYRWSVDGRECAFGASGERWLTAVLEVIADGQQIASIRGEVGSLRGEIGSLRGHEGSLRGEIGSLHGRRGSLQGEIGSLRGEIGSLRGGIGSLRGQIGSLRGQRHRQNDDERAASSKRIRQLEAEIDELEAGLRRREAEVENEIAAIRTKMAAYDDDGEHITAIQAKIAALDTDGHIAEIDAKIDALDADRRVGDLERALPAKVEALEQAMAAGSC